MRITKADGTTEAFEPEKLIHSLKRSGAAPQIAEAITHDIEKEIWEGMSTQEIYTRAFAKLREDKRGMAARYSLKRAVLDFGPSGFPFEDYLGELFRVEGNKVHVRQTIPGKCVEHEIDVVVEEPNGKKVFVEAKFHNAAGFKTDLKVALYVQARIDDLGGGSGLVATNTKFTQSAISYASCKGLELLGWDYPQDKTLHQRIEAAQLYPITALTTISRTEKTALLSQKMVLCNSLTEKTQALRQAGVTGKRADAVLEEVGALCVPGKGV